MFTVEHRGKSKGGLLMAAPLEGIRVLDLSLMLPGPFCSMIFGDFGADVLKIERPVLIGSGEEGPWKLVKNTNLMTDRNKRSITLNLKSKKGKEIFFKLAKDADVILEGFRPGVMKRLGISYEILKKINPKIICCSISCYGQDGPYREKVGHDINCLGVSGVLDVTGKANDSPAIPGILVGDIGAGGMVATIAILLAIIWREKTGKGQYIDVSMLDGLISFMLPVLADFLMAGDKSPRGECLSTGGFAAYNTFKTSDGKYIAMGNSEPQHWRNFCKKICREDFIEYQYAKGDKRKEILSFITELFTKRTRDEWIKEMEGEDICISPVNTVDEVLSDPHVVERGLLQEVHRSMKSDKIPILRVPMKMSENPGEIKTPAPEIGQHTEEVLIGLGYTKKDIVRLQRNKIV
jgi:crotonobetainyl-CoA:carnitine CoA-transferase CaiB-like acyl-CoA transferase